MTINLNGRTWLYPLLGDPIVHARSLDWPSKHMARRGMEMISLPMELPEGTLAKVMAQGDLLPLDPVELAPDLFVGDVVAGHGQTPLIACTPSMPRWVVSPEGRARRSRDGAPDRRRRPNRLTAVSAAQEVHVRHVL